MGVDVSQVEALARDLERAPRRLKRETRRTMKKSALEVKKGMQRDFRGHSYAPSVWRSLEFQPRGEFGYEIGELDSSGPHWGIAAILAFGTSNNAPVDDHTAALRRETPKMVDYLGQGAEDAVFGGAE
jgi:hypothetical protein